MKSANYSFSQPALRRHFQRHHRRPRSELPFSSPNVRLRLSTAATAHDATAPGRLTRIGQWLMRRPDGGRRPVAPRSQDVFDRLDRWMWRQHNRQIESYLAGSTDVFDLERRLQALERSARVLWTASSAVTSVAPATIWRLVACGPVCGAALCERGADVAANRAVLTCPEFRGARPDCAPQQRLTLERLSRYNCCLFAPRSP